MPVIEDVNYRPSGILKLRHVNTMYPYLLRKPANPPYERTRMETPDGDFVDLDWLRSGAANVAILCHGLEGSSGSQYIQHTAVLLHAQGWDVCALNYRSCSGQLNRTPTMYHSGFTQDLHEVVTTQMEQYDTIGLVGFSLGGNMILKYLGDGRLPIDEKVKAAVTMSVPTDLAGSSAKIGAWYNYPYEVRFLKTLLPKMRAKQEQHPDVIPLASIQKVNSLVTFDDYFTGPLHGFRDAAAYYSQCNSLQFLDQISLPTLLINALDDPFLSAASHPFDIAASSKYLHFKAPKFGGHVGFTTFGQLNYWNEIETLTFLNQQL